MMVLFVCCSLLPKQVTQGVFLLLEDSNTSWLIANAKLALA